MDRERLSPEDWIAAALDALRGGVHAVRIESLARSLGVSKGSFYWHFPDRQALLGAMLDTWRATATQSVIDRVEARGGSPADRLRHLFRVTTRADADTIESAIRAWGRTDPSAQEALAKTDRERMDYVSGLLCDHGIRKAEAKNRARALYLTLIGEFTWVSHGGESTPMKVWQSLLELMLTTSRTETRRR